MFPLRFLPHRFDARRCLLAVCAIVALLVQPWVSATRLVAMANGTPVCTSGGDMKMVDADGQPMQAMHHPCLDCCSASLLGLPPVLAWNEPRPVLHTQPAELITASRRDAQWLSPLSRGPPSLS